MVANTKLVVVTLEFKITKLSDEDAPKAIVSDVTTPLILSIVTSPDKIAPIVPTPTSKSYK